MANEKLMKWIKEELSKGYTQKQLEQALLKKGFDRKQAEEAFSSHAEVSNLELHDWVHDGLLKGYTKEQLRKILLDNGEDRKQIDEALGFFEEKKSHELAGWIKNGLSKGYSPKQLEQILIKQGYNEKDIDAAFEEYEEKAAKLREEKPLEAKAEKPEAIEKEEKKPEAVIEKKKPAIIEGAEKRHWMPIITLILSILGFFILFAIAGLLLSLLLKKKAKEDSEFFRYEKTAKIAFGLSIFWIGLNVIVGAAYLFQGFPIIAPEMPETNACTDAKIIFIYAANRPCYDTGTKKAVIMISNTGKGLAGYNITIEGNSQRDKTLSVESQVDTRALTNEMFKIEYGKYENNIRISRITIMPKAASNGKEAYCPHAKIEAANVNSLSDCETIRV